MCEPGNYYEFAGKKWVLADDYIRLHDELRQYQSGFLDMRAQNSALQSHPPMSQRDYLEIRILEVGALVDSAQENGVSPTVVLSLREQLSVLNRLLQAVCDGNP